MDNIQKCLIAPCNVSSTDHDVVEMDISALLRRLITFETYVLQTIRFKEFAHLVRKLGVPNVLVLLESGALTLELDPALLVQSGQSTDPRVRTKRPLPLHSFSFALIRGSTDHRHEYLFENLKDLDRELYGFVPEVDRRRVQGAILNAMVPENAIANGTGSSGFFALDGLESDLRSNSPVFRRSIALAFNRAKGADIREEDFKVKIIGVEENDFKVESNLVKDFGVNDEEAHRIVQSALLAVGTLNHRFGDMMLFNALSGSLVDELSLFDLKLDVFTKRLSPPVPRKKLPAMTPDDVFGTILQVRKLPPLNFIPLDRSFDANHFLEVRASRECADFRAYLRNLTSASDREIEDRVTSLKERLGPIVHGSPGKFARIAIASIVGLASDTVVPFAGLPVGVALDIIDSFLLERYLPLTGPALFLSRSYPSLFKSEIVHSNNE